MQKFGSQNSIAGRGGRSATQDFTASKARNIMLAYFHLYVSDLVHIFMDSTAFLLSFPSLQVQGQAYDLHCSQ